MEWVMCNEMPYTYDMPWEGYGFCSPMLGLWFFHNKQARQLGLQLRWQRAQALKATRTRGGNGRAVRLAEMEATPWPVQVRATEDMVKSHYCEDK